MATFPEIPEPLHMTVSPVFKTVIVDLGSGDEERKIRQQFPKFDVMLEYLKMSDENMEILWQFYVARKGAGNSFYIYDQYVSMAHESIYLDTGDGESTLYDLPGRTTSGLTIYFNNVSQGSGWNKLTGGGASESDRIQFDTAPSAGVIVSVDFTGYLRIKCRFLNDNMDRLTFHRVVHGIGLQLKGLRFTGVYTAPTTTSSTTTTTSTSSTTTTSTSSTTTASTSSTTTASTSSTTTTSTSSTTTTSTSSTTTTTS